MSQESAVHSLKQLTPHYTCRAQHVLDPSTLGTADCNVTLVDYKIQLSGKNKTIQASKMLFPQLPRTL